MKYITEIGSVLQDFKSLKHFSFNITSYESYLGE